MEFLLNNIDDLLESKRGGDKNELLMEEDDFDWDYYEFLLAR